MPGVSMTSSYIEGETTSLGVALQGVDTLCGIETSPRINRAYDLNHKSQWTSYCGFKETPNIFEEICFFIPFFLVLIL